ncbi:MAG: twin-arginine translocation signal domain-containing protein [Flavisolibacter sp.]|nr:twin-arginine translocation signal domain-containing protein [Flavisolibacter sp.]MBD0288057.1 twin-arginine translocation signal domain-containing protein [Flavisolibacter sp.]MBD0364802.1 twin-arginine translocation signal domain-containing protein [Flavisolibacter sp.]MBD0375397.1 twin-arginine translocation signal domain-containing protein [Flavisolibacter sp.]
MEKYNSNHENNQSRRKFIQQSAVLGAGLMLAGT